MKIFTDFRVGAILLLSAFTGHAFAVSYSTYHNDSLINYWPGFNQSGEFGFGDDVIFDTALHTDSSNQLAGQPLNPTGSSASYHVPDPTVYGVPADGAIVGFLSGVVSLASAQVQLGVNTIDDVQVTDSDQNVFNPYGDGNDIDAAGNPTTPIVLNAALPNSVLVGGLPATLTVNADQTIGNDYFVEWEGGTSGFYSHYQSFGWVLAKGQNPADIFSDQLVINFFESVIPLIDQTNPNWTVFGSEYGTLTQIDSSTDVPFATLNSSQVFFSEDIGAALVPVPAAVILFLSGLTGLFGVQIAAKRRQ